MSMFSLRWRAAQFLERHWWRRYLRGKSPVAYLDDKRAYWARTLRQLDWEPEPDRHVLDAGCGPAGLFLLLHEMERVTAVDPLLERYAADLAVFDPTDYPTVDFRTATLEELPAPDRPYDAVYCCNAINHVSDWGRALDRLTAVTAPGGRLLLTSDVHRHPWLLPLFRALPGDALHPQQHGPAAYRRALTRRGWTIEREVQLRRTTIFDYVAWVARKSDESAR